MRVKVPQILGGITVFSIKDLKEEDIKRLESVGIKVMPEIVWDYTWIMNDDQDQWERGKRQEELLKELNLL
jgi:hypothetical protein